MVYGKALGCTCSPLTYEATSVLEVIQRLILIKSHAIRSSVVPIPSGSFALDLVDTVTAKASRTRVAQLLGS